MGRYGTVIQKKYSVDADGNITSSDVPIDINSNNPSDPFSAQKARIDAQSQASFNEAMQKSNDLKTKKLQDTYEKTLAETTSQENAKNALAQQIAALSGGNQLGTTIGAASQVLPAGLSASSLDAISGGISQLALAQNPAITALSSGNNFATSPLANKLNFQVSDQQTRRLQVFSKGLPQRNLYLTSCQKAMRVIRPPRFMSISLNQI